MDVFCQMACCAATHFPVIHTQASDEYSSTKSLSIHILYPQKVTFFTLTITTGRN